MRQPWLAALSMTSSLAGCVVGPNYAGPPHVAAAENSAPFHRVGDLPVSADPVADRWWEGLNDPLLTLLVDRALASSPTVAAAGARLRQADAAAGASRAARLPTAKVSGSYISAGLPANAVDGLGGSGAAERINIEDYSLGANASWELDFFGKLSRTTEQDRDKAGSASAKLVDAQVILAANVVRSYVGLRADQSRLLFVEKSEHLQQQIVALNQTRRDRGVISEIDMTKLQNEEAQTRAELLPLQTSIQIDMDELAAFLGQEPGTLDAELAQETMIPTAPSRVAIGDPQSMLRRRPDVRQAERDLAAATAGIGINVAKLFPSVNILGFAGLGGANISDVVNFNDRTTLLAPAISWNFLDFGRTRDQIRQAEAGRDEAFSQYQSAVLGALRDAEGSLSRYRGRISAVDSNRTQLQLADRAMTLAHDRYAAGTISLIDYLNSQKQQLTSQSNLAQSQASLSNEFAGLQKSLGLGYANPF
jgi:NodT family efflux transporter outer membrane factor (OMF) lipoprotein